MPVGGWQPEEDKSLPWSAQAEAERGAGPNCELPFEGGASHQPRGLREGSGRHRQAPQPGEDQAVPADPAAGGGADAGGQAGGGAPPRHVGCRPVLPAGRDPVVHPRQAPRAGGAEEAAAGAAGAGQVVDVRAEGPRDGGRDAAHLQGRLPPHVLRPVPPQLRPAGRRRHSPYRLVAGQQGSHGAGRGPLPGRHLRVRRRLVRDRRHVRVREDPRHPLQLLLP
mmetsp:Transcript_16414/g.29135  ORF Transcript_16414/g.29135 Transcript_16414/m.29135 type:complete len:223 (+) Transcript_16414:474-1142(+)